MTCLHETGKLIFRRMKRTKGIIIILIILFTHNIKAQNWTSLNYNPDQPGLEYNPLKGFMTLWNPGNDFPHSIQGHSYGLNQVMKGMNSFDWTVIENDLTKDVVNGNFSTM